MSVIGPSWLADGTGAVALIALHFVVGVVVIVGFVQTLPVRRCEVRIRHDEAVSGTSFARARAGQVLGPLFLAGPISDLAGAAGSQARVTAIVVALVAFVGLYLALLPPVQPLVRGGQGAIRACLALLAATSRPDRSRSGLRDRSRCCSSTSSPPPACSSRPRIAAIVTGVTAIAVAVGLAVARSEGSTVAAYALTILAIGALMAAFGDLARTNRELAAARAELARAAVSEERLRIARDMHDLLGHTLSLIALKSELATKLLPTDPRRAAVEMTEVQHVTRQALGEVRDAVQSYRRLAIADALDGARAAMSAAGIDCRVQGTAGELPAEVETVLAWGLREATTNVVRHSGARACAITFSARPEAVALEVEDDGGGAARANGGAGLAGLAERAGRVRGTVEAGARPGGGFRLRLTLPLRGT